VITLVVELDHDSSIYTTDGKHYKSELILHHYPENCFTIGQKPHNGRKILLPGCSDFVLLNRDSCIPVWILSIKNKCF
jgi:hypothetical protein